MAKCKRGRQSFAFEIPPVITAWASVAGKKEAEGPLSHTFDIKCRDTYFNQRTWEQAEKHMQQLAIRKLAEKAEGKDIAASGVEVSKGSTVLKLKSSYLNDLSTFCSSVASLYF